MARRYGRNQRRQARETVARLERDLRQTTECYRRDRQKWAEDSMRFRRLASDLIDELPAGSALLEELTVEVLGNWPPMLHRQAMPLQAARPCARAFLKDAAITDLATALKIVDLVTYKLQVDFTPFSDRIRFRVENDKTNDVAYCVDAQYLMQQGFSDRMVREMAQKIAESLASFWKEGVVNARG